METEEIVRSGLKREQQQRTQTRDLRRRTVGDDEDWTRITDLRERRKIQNRLSQRNYRFSIKRRLEELEKQVAASNSDRSLPAASKTSTRAQTPAETLQTDKQRNEDAITTLQRYPSPSEGQLDTLRRRTSTDREEHSMFERSVSIPDIGNSNSSANCNDSFENNQRGIHSESKNDILPISGTTSIGEVLAADVGSTLAYSTLSDYDDKGFDLRGLPLTNDEIDNFISFGNFPQLATLDMEDIQDLSKSSQSNTSLENPNRGVVTQTYGLESPQDFNKGLKTLGKSTLHLAVEHGHAGIVSLILQRGGIISCRDQNGQTPLHLAAQTQRPAIIDILLKSGANVDEGDNDKKSPLHVASQFNDEAAVESILAAHPQINGRDASGRTALYYAIERGHEKIVDLLLKKGADVNAKVFEQS